MEIAEKYGYTADDINTYDDLKGLLLAIGTNEVSNGMYAFYASQSANLQQIALQFENNLINNQASDYVYYSQLTDPTFENPFFLYTSDMYKEYALKWRSMRRPASGLLTRSPTPTPFPPCSRTSSLPFPIITTTTASPGLRRPVKRDRLRAVRYLPRGYRALRDSI